MAGSVSGPVEPKKISCRLAVLDGLDHERAATTPMPVSRMTLPIHDNLTASKRACDFSP